MDEKMAQPSIDVYTGLISDVIRLAFVEDKCVRWAQPRWLGDILSIIVLILLFINIYAITLLLTNRSPSVRNSFYTCVIALFVGEAVMLIVSVREPDLQQCILHTPVQHLAIQTVGTFGLELTVAVNLTLAAVRLVTLLFGPKQANTVAGIGIIISVIWSSAMCAFHQLGLVTKIWLDENGKYADRLLSPFNIIRIPLLITELSATFLLYMVTIILLKTKSGSHAVNMIKSERRFLIQSLLTFLSELIHLYGTFWIGHRYLHLGDAQFNANLNFISRPISVGLTPIYYIMFSKEIRNEVLRMIHCYGRTIHVHVFHQRITSKPTVTWHAPYLIRLIHLIRMIRFIHFTIGQFVEMTDDEANQADQVD